MYLDLIKEAVSSCVVNQRTLQVLKNLYVGVQSNATKLLAMLTDKLVRVKVG